MSAGEMELETEGWRTEQVSEDHRKPGEDQEQQTGWGDGETQRKGCGR